MDPNKALVYPYHVYFYIKENHNTHICLFHRFGRGGTKTAFMKEINSYLQRKYNYILKTKAIINEEYRNELLTGTPLSYRYTAYKLAEKSNDKVDNINGPVVEKYVELFQVKINLKNKKMKEKFNLDIKDITNPKISFEDFPLELTDEYDKTTQKIDMFINGRTKVWDIEGTTIYDYEISDELIYKLDNHPTDKSIESVMDRYFEKFKLGVNVNDY